MFLFPNQKSFPFSDLVNRSLFRVLFLLFCISSSFLPAQYFLVNKHNYAPVVWTISYRWTFMFLVSKSRHPFLSISLLLSGRFWPQTSTFKWSCINWDTLDSAGLVNEFCSEQCSKEWSWEPYSLRPGYMFSLPELPRFIPLKYIKLPSILLRVVKVTSSDEGQSLIQSQSIKFIIHKFCEGYLKAVNFFLWQKYHFLKIE